MRGNGFLKGQLEYKYLCDFLSLFLPIMIKYAKKLGGKWKKFGLKSIYGADLEYVSDPTLT